MSEGGRVAAGRVAAEFALEYFGMFLWALSVELVGTGGAGRDAHARWFEFAVVCHRKAVS